jgi:hypothetical protein
VLLKDAQLAYAYEKSNAKRIAFIDESFQVQSRKSLPFYAMTATLVSSIPVHLESTRFEVRALVGDQFHATSQARTAHSGPIGHLLDYIRESNIITNILTVETEMLGPKYMMRAATLAQLLVKISEDVDAPDVLVADAQDPQWQQGAKKLDRNDQAVVTELIERRIIGSRTRILHSKSTHENLLHLPDTVQWAAQKALREGHSASWDKVSARSTVYCVQMDGPVTLTGGIVGVRQQARAGASAESRQLSPSSRVTINDLNRRGPRTDLLSPAGRPPALMADSYEMNGSLARYLSGNR